MATFPNAANAAGVPVPRSHQFVYRAMQSADLAAEDHNDCEEAEQACETSEQVGWQAGYQQAKAEAESEIASIRGTVAIALTDFERDTEKFYSEAEAQMVKLSLAIARKVLEREARIDPVLMNIAVQSAIESISSSTTVRLCVHPDDASSWMEVFEQQGPTGVEIVCDSLLARGACRLESEFGNAEIGVESRLSEIHDAFFDLPPVVRKHASRDARVVSTNVEPEPVRAVV
jgi:flagellar assembly protein FliH